MPLFTKAQTRTAVRQAIDDPSSQRWSDANLDLLITMVLDTMFQAILDTFPWFLSQTDVMTPTSGAITLASGTPPTGLSKRFYRMQDVVRVSDSLSFQPKLYTERVPQPSYHLLGSNAVTDPAIAGASSASVVYSYMPTRFTDLAADTTTLSDYPEGHEAALVYLSAAWAMTKGDAESMAQIGRIADAALDSLLTHLARRSPTGALARVATVKAAIVRQLGLGGAQQQ